MFINKKPVSNRKLFLSLIIFVACVFIIICLLVFILHFFGNSSLPTDKNGLRNIYLQDKIYEVCEINGILSRYGMSTVITSDMTGEHIAYLRRLGDGNSQNSSYEISEVKTNIELCSVKSVPLECVAIVCDEGNYMAAVFCNYRVDSDKCMPFSELFDLYGISSPEDLHSVRPTFRFLGKNFSMSSAASSLQVKSEFYRLCSDLEPYSFDYVQKSDKIALTDGIQFQVTTASGIPFYITVYQESGWIESAETMSYYQMTEEMCSWFDKNFK